MKFIKISLAIVAVLLLVIAVALGAFVATFDANDYRPQISEQVKQHTGRAFNIEDIKPSVFPWVGMELQQIELGNAAGFDEEKMLTIQRLDVKVELIPLIRQQIHIDTLRIHGLNVSLEKNKQGKTNWDDIIARQSAGTTTAATASSQQKKHEPAVEDTSSGNPLAGLLVNGIDIRDANIRWKDSMQNQQAALKQFNLTSGEFQLGQLLPVKMNTQVELSQPQAKFDIDLQTKVDFNPQTQLLNIPELLLGIIAEGEVIPQGKMDLKLKAQANMDLQKQLASITGLELQVMGLTIKANADITELQTAAKAKAHIELLPFDARELSKKLAIELPPMQNPNALKQISAKLDVVATDKTASIKPFMLKLDASTINGMLSISQFDKPAIQYELALDAINVDDYLPPPPPEATGSKSESTAVAVVPASDDIAIELPVELIRGLNINGQFTAGKLLASGYELNNLTIKTAVNKGIVSASPIKAELLEGNIDASLKLDVRNEIPFYSIALNAKGVKADSIVTPVLQELSGEKEVALNGASDLDLNIESRGQSVKSLIAASNGKLKLDVGEAVLHGVDSEYFVRKAVTGYLEEKNQQVPDSWKGTYQPKQTSALKTARATAKITNGVVDNQDLLLEASRFKITGAGKVMLPAEKLDYRLIVDMNPANAKTTAEKLLDVPVPVKVKGNFTAPVIDIDRTAWLKNLGGGLAAEKKKQITQAIEQKKQQQVEKVEKKVEEKKEEIKTKIEDKAKDKLKSLFGR